ncbi:MAG: hypothetical protein WAN65_08245 [Candidatus Sulfotelmatobacter sp.]
MSSLVKIIASWSAACGALCEKLAPRCAYAGCIHAHSRWNRMRRRKRGTRMQGSWYCRPECLEHVLVEILRRGRTLPRLEPVSSHRVPLGLLLLSRQQLTAAQLKSTLEAQRAAGRGKIGEWLQQLGFVTEPQVTAALARQWSCPVLRTGVETLGAARFTGVPLLLLEAFQMIPVEFVKSTSTLLIAFSDGIDYTTLYAVEQMLGCHTQPCVVSPAALQRGLQALAQHHTAGDVVFDGVQNGVECAHIIGSYTANVRAQEVRLARCGEHLWVRLERFRKDAVNVILRAPAHIMHNAPLRPIEAAAAAV